MPYYICKVTTNIRLVGLFFHAHYPPYLPYNKMLILLYIILFTVWYTSLLNILHTVLHTILYIEEEAGRAVLVKMGQHAYIYVLLNVPYIGQYNVKLQEKIKKSVH